MRTLPVPDPTRQIAEFSVFTTDRGWKAVHKKDPAIVVELATWGAVGR